jgi:hypothetical protein
MPLLKAGLKYGKEITTEELHLPMNEELVDQPKERQLNYYIRAFGQAFAYLSTVFLIYQAPMWAGLEWQAIIIPMVFTSIDNLYNFNSYRNLRFFALVCSIIISLHVLAPKQFNFLYRGSNYNSTLIVQENFTITNSNYSINDIALAKKARKGEKKYPSYTLEKGDKIFLSKFYGDATSNYLVATFSSKCCQRFLNVKGPISFNYINRVMGDEETVWISGYLISDLIKRKKVSFRQGDQLPFRWSYLWLFIGIPLMLVNYLYIFLIIFQLVHIFIFAKEQDSPI